MILRKLIQTILLGLIVMCFVVLVDIGGNQSLAAIRQLVRNFSVPEVATGGCQSVASSS